MRYYHASLQFGEADEFWMDYVDYLKKILF